MTFHHVNRKKLDKILKQLTKFDERFDNIEKKLDKFQKRLEKVESFFHEKSLELDDRMEAKVDRDELNALKSEFESFAECDGIESLTKELYDKRLNILMHGLDKTESA